MTQPTHKPHHPVPEDGRARHDLLPEGVEDVRAKGEDNPEAPEASATKPPTEQYRNPDGTLYKS